MEYVARSRVIEVADVHDAREGWLTRTERLGRWAELLERDPHRLLRSLGEIEFKTAAERRVMRADGSSLSVAFADPVLRTAGLESDRLGDAVTFFGLTDRQAHRLFCSCMNGMSTPASILARRVRGLSKPGLFRGLMTWLWFRDVAAAGYRSKSSGR